jgi:hypothetical protein
MIQNSLTAIPSRLVLHGRNTLAPNRQKNTASEMLNTGLHERAGNHNTDMCRLALAQFLAGSALHGETLDRRRKPAHARKPGVAERPRAGQTGETTGTKSWRTKALLLDVSENSVTELGGQLGIEPRALTPLLPLRATPLPTGESEPFGV